MQASSPPSIPISNSKPDVLKAAVDNNFLWQEDRNKVAYLQNYINTLLKTINSTNN